MYVRGRAPYANAAAPVMVAVTAIAGAVNEIDWNTSSRYVTTPLFSCLLDSAMFIWNMR